MLDMPTTHPARTGSRLELFKVLLMTILTLVFIAILVVLLFVPRDVDVRLSNENIARLQREQILLLETRRTMSEQKLAEAQQNLTVELAEVRREFDLSLAAQQAQVQREFHEKNIEMMRINQKRDQEQQEKLQENYNGQVFADFVDKFFENAEKFDPIRLRWQVEASILRSDAFHKSMMIKFLYENEFLQDKKFPEKSISLGKVNLTDLVLNKMAPETEDFSPQMNFAGLSLPGTILINSSMELIVLDEADFSRCQMDGASFRYSQGVQNHFYQATLSLSNFRWASFINATFIDSTIVRGTFDNANLYLSQFSHADLTSCNFAYTNLVETQLDRILGPEMNFFGATAVNANFNRAYLPQSSFVWSDLREASFREAYLSGSNFENANIVDVDFTGAYLIGAKMTQEQLALALSISRTYLPDESRGKNKNFIVNRDDSCTQVNNTISDWYVTGLITAIANRSSNGCHFQGLSVNATLTQRIDLQRYQRLIEKHSTDILVEVKTSFQSENHSVEAPIILIDLNFFDFNNSTIESNHILLSSTGADQFQQSVNLVPCPTTTVAVQVNVSFIKLNVTIEDIYITLN